MFRKAIPTLVGNLFFQLKAAQHESQLPIEYKSKFDLQKSYPQAKNAKQVLLENPEKIFIGVFHIPTKQSTEAITLMAAMDGEFTFSYNKDGDITFARRDHSGIQLNEEELAYFNKEYKFFIPRQCYRENTHKQVSHEIVLFNMGRLDDKKDFYGFTVLPGKDGPRFCWNSVSLNRTFNGDWYDYYDKPWRTDKIEIDARIAITQTILSWVEDCKKQPEEMTVIKRSARL